MYYEPYITDTPSEQVVQQIVYGPADSPVPCEECQAPAKFIIGGAPLCNQHFNHPNVRCPECGHRVHGRYADDDGDIACLECGRAWKATD